MPYETSCYSTSLLIQYARQHGFNDDILFDGIRDKKNILENRHEHIDYTIVNRFTENFEKCGGDLFKAAIEITENQVTNFQLIALKIASLPFLLKNYSKQYEKITSLISLKTEQRNDGEVDIVFTPKDRSLYSSQNCDYNKGCTFATFKLKRFRNIQLSEITCCARSSARECRYRITWTPGSPFLQRLKNYLHFRFSSENAILTHMEETNAELQKQYKEILAMQDFYSHIMGNMDEAVVWLDKNGLINFTNNGFLTLTEIEEEKEAHGKLFSDFLLNNHVINEYNRLIANSFSNPLKAQNAEFLIKGKNGSKKFGQTSIIWVPSEHRAPGYLITIHDITDQKIIEQQLDLEQDKHRALYENSPALIIGLDVNGKFVYANPAAVEQSGYSEEELKSMNFKQLVAPEADNLSEGIINNLLNQPSRLQEVHFKSKKGEWKSITLTTYQIFDADGTLAGVAGVGVDITETKRLNEQLIRTQRMELLGQMAGGMAHDFKNMLASINGYCTLIAQKSQEPKIQQYLGIMEQASVRASDLLKNLLAFSRGSVSEMQKFDINGIAKEIAALMKGIAAKSTTIDIMLPESPTYILGDPGQIHQCVLNLCMNANDALGDKKGSIIIKVKPAEGKDNHAWIQVEDTGSGISPDIIEKIFDPFFTTKKKTGGTGLGLSVVYGIIKAHKGTVLVDSRPGEGTTFTLELPGFVEDGVKAPDSRKTIMVIDDDDVPRTYCMEILRRSGYKAIDFSNVKDAVEWLRKNPEEFWFVICDVVMPDMDINGFLEACRKIKDDFTCVWMSGHITPEIENLSHNGIFLKKPFTPTDLIETIKSLKFN